MDGTLTVPVHDFPAIKTELGTPLDIDILHAISLMSAEDAKRAHVKLQEIEFRLASIGRVAAGTIELLQALSDNGCSLGILTRNSLINTEETLRASGLNQFFREDFIISRDQATPKPSPDGIHILLDKWNASPNDAVMVGDYIFDLEAGNRAGLKTIYVDPTGEFVFRSHASHCVRQLDEVLEI
ncbi:MAG TPA: HAD family hydrolase [Leptospiraceae bacterium]|nr:HAD family hydrolase [Leptospiraceae bacterium]HMW06890.1 HAD family hydrolase [Leptospiraceae bacterium]HNA07604.1 HAD family hydrolase [Leptospiraceae bacterium]HNM90482.1 HAD family hydrolase [Leptospiraceae bacterium]